MIFYARSILGVTKNTTTTTESAKILHYREHPSENI